jgi:hypothetical protein
VARRRGGGVPPTRNRLPPHRSQQPEPSCQPGTLTPIQQKLYVSRTRVRRLQNLFVRDIPFDNFNI